MTHVDGAQEDGLQVAREGAVLAVRLARPRQRNAMDAPLRQALAAVLQRVAEDETIRVVTLSGEGPVFCAGTDLREVHAKPVEALLNDDYRPLVTGIAESRAIWIAAVRGPAAGIGAAFAMACDLMAMTDDASLQMAFAALSLVPDGGNTWFLQRALGHARALELIVTGGRLDAASAQAAGLANHVWPQEGFEDAVAAWASDLARAAPLATPAAKRLLRRVGSMSLGQAISAEAQEQGGLSRSADFREGVAAFLEKRAPRFEGR